MFQNKFSVRIPEGAEDSGGYVELQHGQHFTVRLRNFRGVRCDARVEVNGKDVGTFRLSSHGSACLERPGHDEGCFTFYRASSEEASTIYAGESPSDFGLVRVTFVPEKPISIDWHYKASLCGAPKNVGSSYSLGNDVLRGGGSQSAMPYAAMPMANSAHQREAGVVGLSGHSNQQFYSVGPMNLDYSQQTVIHLRLVCVENGPRPLTSYSTPVPPPL